MRNLLLVLLMSLFVNLSVSAQTAESDSLYAIGVSLYEQEKYEDAIPYFTSCDSIDMLTLDEKDERNGYGKQWLSACYYKLGNADKAKELRSKYYMTNPIDRRITIECDSLLNIAFKLIERRDYNKALDCLKHSLTFERNNQLTETVYYANTLTCLSRLFGICNNYKNAILYGIESLQTWQKVVGNQHLDYANSLNDLASYNWYLGNYGEAIRLGTKALQVRKISLGRGHLDYAIALNNLALYHSNIGNFVKAISLGIEAQKIYENVLGQEHSDYALCLSNLALYNSYMGNYSEAIRLGTKALHINEKALGKEHSNYALALNNLASYYSNIANYSEAIRFGTEALSIRKIILGEEHPEYAITLNNLAHYNSSLGNYYEAIRIETQALQILEKIEGKEHPNYATYLSNLASYYHSIGEYSKAISIIDNALQIYKKTLGNEHPLYSTCLANLATCHSFLRNYSEALRFGNEALQIRKKIFGKIHPDYISSLKNMYIDYCNIGNYNKMGYLLTESYQIYSKYIQQNVFFLSSIDRKKMLDRTDIQLIKKYAYKAKVINELQRTNYDALLFSKNLGLNIEHEMLNAIAESGDSTLKVLSETIKTNKLIANKLLETPISARSIDVDSLYNVIQEQERELASKSKEYGDFTKSLSITHKDVKNKLRNGDIAIEFVETSLSEDSVIYYVLTLRNDYEYPHLVTLFEKKQLDEVMKQELTDKSTMLSILIWSPLMEELKNVKNIYFSPSGDLYKIGLENLPSPDGNGGISDKYNLFRLSSTRELALDMTKNDSKDAAVYGGIQYSADEANISVLEANARLYASINRSDENLYNPYIDSLGVNRDDRKDPNKGRYLPSLPNAKIEATTVTKTINDAHIKDFTATVFTDTATTEASFKALSGQKKRLIHIATHGFYYKEADSLKYKDFMPQMFLDERNKHRYVEDKQLTRSGLYFAGADNRRLGKKIPDGVDDGILTAQEISMLDLRGCDLVVLSACQTAQGDLGADGVFGLQRAFKKAGVNSILMSIDKIDDRATQLLMTEFYKNYVKGVSKQESLKRAQKYLREETEYKDAKYWSSFILLDALD